MGATSDKPHRPSKPKGPSLASIRRHKTLSTDGHTVKFLYLMLKQFNLKSVDWQAIAEKTDMPEGRAARLRFNRFKTQMDKLLRSEELLEAKLEETREDVGLERKDTKARVLGYLDDLDFDQDNSIRDVNCEQEMFGQGGDFAIKPEPDASTTMGWQFKLEANDHEYPRSAFERTPVSTVIKIEDDDPIEAVEGGYDAQYAVQETSQFLHNASRHVTQTRPTAHFDGFGTASASSARYLPMRNSRCTSDTPWTEKQSNTMSLDNGHKDSEIEFIGTNRRPSVLPRLSHSQQSNCFQETFGFDEGARETVDD